MQLLTSAPIFHRSAALYYWHDLPLKKHKVSSHWHNATPNNWCLNTPEWTPTVIAICGMSVAAINIPRQIFCQAVSQTAAEGFKCKRHYATPSMSEHCWRLMFPGRWDRLYSGMIWNMPSTNSHTVLHSQWGQWGKANKLQGNKTNGCHLQYHLLPPNWTNKENLGQRGKNRPIFYFGKILLRLMIHKLNLN